MFLSDHSFNVVHLFDESKSLIKSQNNLENQPFSIQCR